MSKKLTLEIYLALFIATVMVVNNSDHGETYLCRIDYHLI